MAKPSPQPQPDGGALTGADERALNMATALEWFRNHEREDGEAHRDIAGRVGRVEGRMEGLEKATEANSEAVRELAKESSEGRRRIYKQLDSIEEKAADRDKEVANAINSLEGHLDLKRDAKSVWLNVLYALLSGGGVFIFAALSDAI